jgi:hypothetical protein
MTEPRDMPAGPDDLGLSAALDEALDDLAAGREVRADPGGGEVAAQAGLAAEVRTAVPPSPPDAAERGRAAFLALAAELGPAGPSRAAGRRRSLAVRVVALAAALVLLVAVPAVARQARPGTALWPLRQVGQQVRVGLTDDPAHRAHLRLSTAGQFLAAGAGAGEERREEMADRAEDLIKDVQDDLKNVAGPEAAAERARAEQMLLQVEALERQDDPGDRSGGGGGGDQEGGEDRSGRGGGDDQGGDDRSGRGGGGDDDRSGSGSGSSGSGSGSSGSDRSGSGHD